MSATTTRPILIRCDGGDALGLGHVMRCLALGRALLAAGASVELVLRPNASAEEKVRASGLGLRVLPAGDASAELLALACGHAGGVLILDLPGALSLEQLRELRKHLQVVVLQNESEGAWASDLLVFPAGHHADEIEVRCRAAQNCLVGLDYVLLSEAALAPFTRAPYVAPTIGASDPEALPTQRGGITRAPYVALTTGASDPEGLLPRWLGWLAGCELELPVVALVGSSFQSGEALTESIAARPDSIEVEPFSSERLFGASLAVATFGVTVYELLYRGVPTLTVGHSERAAAASDRFATRYGATVSLGDGRTLERARFLEALREAIANLHATTLREVLIDGRGASRIAAAILALRESEGDTP